MKMKCMAMALALTALTVPASAREVVDMVGRHVTIPDKLTKLYAPSPYGAFMMYAIAPDLMAGLITAPKEGDKKYLPPSLRELPAIGGAGVGAGPTANPESLLKTGAQLLILWRAEAQPISEKTTAQYDKLGIPYVFVNGTSLDEYPAAIRYLGKLLNREKRAEKMALLAEKTLKNAQAVANSVPAGQRPRVYYAEGVDGLQTECDDSIHVQLLKKAGDVNVHRCHTASHMGMEKISLEQVMMYNPDVIVAQERMFTDKVYTDVAWSSVKAVREHKVYLIPHAPLNWFDRPPSFMRFAGLVWLTNKLYPKQYPVNLVRETRNFYSVFLGVDLSENDVKEILAQ